MLQRVVFPTISVCNFNQIEVSTMKDFGVYKDSNLTDLLVKEFILGNNESLTPNASEFLNGVKEKVKNEYGDDFALHASQGCHHLMLTIKFQGKTLFWEDFDYTVGQGLP